MDTVAKMMNRAMGSIDFCESVENHKADHGVNPREWILDSIYTEVAYLKRKYEMDGYSQFDALNSDDKYDRKIALSEYGKLSRLCAALVKAGAVSQGTAPKFD